MEALRIISFIAMVILEAIMMIIISIKNKNLQGQNAFKLALSLLGILIMSIFFAYMYFDLDNEWDGLVAFMFIITMLLTYLINEYEVSEYNITAYNESKRAFKIIAWVSIVAIIINIITTAPKSPYWVSRDFFYWKLIHYI